MADCIPKVTCDMHDVFTHFLGLFSLNSWKHICVSLVNIPEKNLQSLLKTHASFVCIALDFNALFWKCDSQRKAGVLKLWYAEWETHYGFF